MASKTTYKSNINKAIKALLDGSAAAIIEPVANSLKDKIKQATPVLTGKTRDSIETVQHSKFGQTIKTEQPGSVYIEFGTEDTPVFGMFRKTFDKNVVQISKKLEEDFRKHIEKNARV